ncbi:MAG: hypothetical protein ACLTXL_12070, partial [Clostridia bacterium]
DFWISQLPLLFFSGGGRLFSFLPLSFDDSFPFLRLIFGFHGFRFSFLAAAGDFSSFLPLFF